MELSLILGILSFIISIVAIVIAIKSGRIIKAIANLEYDEKLAIMASHSERIKTDKTLGSIERLKNDFSAVSNLQRYANNKKKEELIENYIVPILESILEGKVSGQCAVATAELIDIALKYNIATEKLKNFRQLLRRN